MTQENMLFPQHQLHAMHVYSITHLAIIAKLLSCTVARVDKKVVGKKTLQFMSCSIQDANA